MEYWHNRWDKQLTGWHREVFNDLLEKHWSNINPPKDGEVLVPLCGKSLDMIWLAKQGYKVVGLELVQQAIEIFFQENKLEYSSIKADMHTKYSSPPFTIYQGDIFDLQSGMVQADAWYDRAAMVALPNSVRQQYVKQIYNQTKPGAVGLLITFSYPEKQMEGPPFSLPDRAVMDYFSNGFEVECLEKIDLEDEKDRGLSNVTSTVFKITRN
ncbi:MAG: thiopurine S-methyltransferase [Euryarchaeota archaeon]|nr:thiopurine S-methyltransferase [Euryarchaeota archaeon]